MNPECEEKQLHGHFKRQTGENSYERTWTGLRKRSLKRKSESLILTAQNNDIRTKSK